jgi:hypothetical protein
MVAKTKTRENLIDQIAQMSTIEESNQVRQAMVDFKENRPIEEYEQLRRALSKRLSEIAAQGEKELAETADLMQINGMTYNLGEWLTIANYAKKYSVDTHVVTNWIRRETIPADCVVEIPVLNNIRMVKDRPYR